MNKKIRALTAAAVSLSLLLCGCANSSARNPSVTDGGTTAHTSAEPVKATTSEEGSGNVPVEALPGNRGTLLKLEEDHSISISRLTRAAEAASGDKGVWTVFVYMCGTDLESDQASATEDLEEMLDATDECGSLRFVVETDGTSEWQNEICVGKTKQRFLIQGGEITERYSGSSTNMGLSSTLSDFLKWGLNEYSSEFMALVFWNHGGGSITGVCFDENNDFDSLSLKEIDSALASVFGDMTDRFEIIGCDACLMATVETANSFAPYARYMVASQNLESGYGWDYTAFGKAINGGAKNGGEVGKQLCDSYYAYCTYTGEEDDATLSVIDFSEFDAFVKAFNDYANELYRYASETNVTDVIKAGKTALNFGGNNRSEGYTNMIDVKDFLKITSSLAPSASKAASALSSCVIYSQNGYSAGNAGGLCMYYPLSVQGSSELGIFKDICISPYYLSVADLCAYGSSNNGEIDGFDFNGWLDSDSGFWSGSSISDSDYNYWNADDNSSLNLDASNSSLEYEVEPYLDDEGSYVFKLTEDSLYNLDTVYCNVMISYCGEDGNSELMLDLGTDDYVDMDWDTGVCKDIFDGYWFVLPDGQPICVYLIESYYDDNEYYNIYSSPIYLNGEYTNLKIKQSYTDDETVTEVLGAWDGISENGSAARDLIQLKKGDIIEPCYPAYDAATYEYYDDYYGDEYVYDGDPYWEMGFLPDGDYYYSFEIYDYYGNGLYPDFVLFNIEDGELFYYED